MYRLIFVCFCFYGSFLIAQTQETTAVYPFGKADKWGIINSEREIIIKPKHDSIGLFNYDDKNNASAVVVKRGKSGLINSNGKVILKSRYDEFRYAGYYAMHFLKARIGDAWGLVDRYSGKVIIEPEYEEIEKFQGRRQPAAVVKKKGKY